MPQDPTISVSHALRLTAMTGAAVGLVSVISSAFLYAHHHEFSLFTTYLSDIGNTPQWPQVVFNAGMLVAAPLRYLLLILVVLQLRARGTTQALATSMLLVGGVVVAGSIGVSAIPYGTSPVPHETSAFVYFLGAVALQTMLGVEEWRRRLPRILPVASVAVAVIFVIFAILLGSVGKVPGVTRNTPVIWEWLAFCSLMFWLIVHGVLLGRPANLRAAAA